MSGMDRSSHDHLYRERTPTLCTCPQREQTINGVTYEIPVEHEPTEPCPTHDQ